MASKKPAAPRGRPTLLTANLLKLIVQAVRDGNYPVVVCRSVGVAPKTYRNWRTRGRREPNSIYGEFREGIDRARHEFEVAAVSELRKAAKNEPTLLFKMLACTAPHRWGPHVAEIREMREDVSELRRQMEEWRAAATS